MTSRSSKTPSPLRPCSEQLIALAVAGGDGITEDAMRQALAAARQQGWDDRRLLKEVTGMLLRGEDARDLVTAATGGVVRR